MKKIDQKENFVHFELKNKYSDEMNLKDVI